MEITITTVQTVVPVTIMRLAGILDAGSAGYFNERARLAIAGGAENILLDFSQVSFMSSVGIRSLSALHDWLHPVKSAADQRAVSQAVHAGTYQAPHLKLLNPNSNVLKTIKLVALDRYLPIYTDEQQALAAFV